MFEQHSAGNKERRCGGSGALSQRSATSERVGERERVRYKMMYSLWEDEGGGDERLVLAWSWMRKYAAQN